MLAKKIIKFGKSFYDLDKIKSDFFNENDALLKRQNIIKNLYKSEKIRKKCKACQCILKSNYFFISHKIKYIECQKCGHINGKYQDTKNFANQIYFSKKIDYSKEYHAKDIKNFTLRKKLIYDPKAKFLRDIFLKRKKVKILDIGAGSGYLLSSLIDLGFKNVEGIEVSKEQVKFGKIMLKKRNQNSKKLKCLNYSEILKNIKNTDANCITLIGVLEHLSDMESFLKTIKENKKIKYVFLCIPLFSFTCIIESLFDEIYNRHLGGGHTHLFTENSIKKLMKKYGFKSHSEWWFGTDFGDLYRSLKVSLEKRKFSPLNKKITQIKNLINEFQLLLDKKKQSSEAHIFFKR